MSTVDDGDDVKRLRAQWQEMAARLRDHERNWELSERKRRYTDLLFSTAFENSPAAISLSRMRDDRVVDVNKEWQSITGYTHAEAVGHTLSELGQWPDTAARDAMMDDLRATGRVRDREVVVFFTGKERAKYLVRLNAALIDVEGEPHVLMYMKDITAERMAEESVRIGERALTQANQQLGVQLELYNLTESLARVGHWTASADGLSVVFSPGLLDLEGDSHGQPVRSLDQLRESIHVDDWLSFEAARQSMDDCLVEYRWHRKDGSLLWLRSRMHRQLNEDGSVTAVCVVQDVTTEREAAEALKGKLDFIEKLTSRVPDVLYQYQRHPDGRITLPFVSESVRRLFGVEPEAVRANAREMFNRIHPDDLPGMMESMRVAYQDGAQWQHAFRVVRPDNSMVWVRGNAVTLRESNGELTSYGALRDITESKNAATQLQESEMRFRSLTDLSSDWYWETDTTFRFTRFEGYREGKSRITMHESIGKTRQELGALNMTAEGWAAHQRVLEAHLPFRDLELNRVDASGDPYWIAISGTPIFDPTGAFKGYRGIGRDITQRKRAEDETQRLAFYDTLTGLPNRRLLMDRLAHAQITSARSRHHGALLFIDLDNFKDLNDTMGHDVGDQLLERVAMRLVSCLREGDTASRFGGDEFVVMLEDLSASEVEAAAQTEVVADKILMRLNAPYELGEREHISSPSIGITLFCGVQPSVDELLKRADLAMYQAKAAGRNTLRFFDPGMQAVVLARAALDADLRQSIQRDELMLYYQPLVDGGSHVIGYEALLRWRHPTRGMVPPGEFISLAEQTNLILPIGQWVLRTACQQLVDWAPNPATSHLTLAVNVSARQFRQNDFVAHVQDVLRETGVNPHHLKLELTESLLISDVEDAIRKMSALRESGVRFALDDFGTGYSSLSYLKRLPLDQVKVDQSFVRDVLSDPNDAAIVRTILALAHSLELQSVAEGVETEGQRQFLLDNGCDVFQGYLFGRPAPLDNL